MRMADARSIIFWMSVGWLPVLIAILQLIALLKPAWMRWRMRYWSERDKAAWMINELIDNTEPTPRHKGFITQNIAKQNEERGGPK